MEINQKKYIIYAIIISLLFSIGSFCKFSVKHEQLPKGCDQFGYLNMAKAFDKGYVFDDHAPRPFFKGLMDTLIQEGLDEKEYIWMALPHAYHLTSVAEGKVINQYAPGTSYVLSFIPIEKRKQSFAFLVMFFTFLIPFLLAIKYSKLNPIQTLIGISLLLFLMEMSPPFISELANINSLALTFGLLIGVGLTLKKHPLIALFCIALTGNFRIVNLLMLLPMLLFFLPIMWQKFKDRELKSLGIFTLKSGVVLFLGLLPYIYYVTVLLGNPLLPTYDTHDTSFGGPTSLYFSFNEIWFNAHLIIISLLLVLYYFKRLTIKELLVWLAFPIVNYVFFSFHKIQMSYYPFASFFILFGAALYYFGNIQIVQLKKKVIIIIPLVLSLVIGIDGVRRYVKRDHVSFKEVTNLYAPICNYDVVWAELLSGTAEYACNNNGFKYIYSSPESRKIAFNYLINHNYSQVILCDDLPVDRSEIEKELVAYQINYSIKEYPTLGTVIIINGKDGI